jgi:hypothetical protein
MREDERKMMEDTMVPFPDLTTGIGNGTGDREPRVYGAMMGDDDSEEDSLSTGSGDNGLDDHGDDGELMDDDDEDEDDEEDIDMNGGLHEDISGDDF